MKQPLAVDPVCGMAVDPAAAAASVQHEGQTYFFCSPGCARKFSQDPVAYLQGGQGRGTEGMEGSDGPASGSYTPLLVVLGLLLLATLAASLDDWRNGAWSLPSTLAFFMAGFFLVFAGFKLLDLRGFAEGYATYDLLARRWRPYGYLYPFIELFFGLAMILDPRSRPLLVAEIVVMAFSGLGVAAKLARRERFQCACLGTFLKVPLTSVTLVEDFGMAALAVAMLLLP